MEEIFPSATPRLPHPSGCFAGQTVAAATRFSAEKVRLTRKPIGRRHDDEQEAHRRIRLEEGLVDQCNIQRPGDPVLVDQQERNREESPPVNLAEMSRESEGDQAPKHQQMEESSEPQCTRHAKPDHHGAQALATVGLHVLRGVDDVKAGDPAEHPGRKHDRRPGEGAGDSQPRSDGETERASPRKNWAAWVNRFVRE